MFLENKILVNFLFLERKKKTKKKQGLVTLKVNSFICLLLNFYNLIFKLIMININENEDDLIRKTSDLTINHSTSSLAQNNSHNNNNNHHNHNHNRRTSSSSSNLNRSNRYNNQQFHRTQTEGSNLNNYKPPPFQPPLYQNPNVSLDKYDRKYNIVSFILLRKFDDYINEEKIYLNDQLVFNLVKNFIQNLDLNSIVSLFKQNKNMPTHKNSYNSSLFIFTIREALEFKSETSNDWIENLFNFLFENVLPNDLCSLHDGDYPMRNIMHYSAHYNSIYLLNLLFKHLKAPEIDKLCLSTDYNNNTPLHIAVRHDSLDFIKYLFENLKPLFTQLNFNYTYNDDGLNLFLLACRYSSLNLIKYLDETIGLSINLKELNQESLKTCLHLSILRTCDTSDNGFMKTFNIVKYLYNKNNFLAYELSPLVGSLYHLAASNLTRIHLLWYFINNYNSSMDTNRDAINSTDFRDYSCIDCFMETLINVKAIIPSKETVYSFYKKCYFKSDELKIYFNDENSFNLLVRKCLFKLITKCKAKITKLPQIKTQLELLEFIRLIKFMSKFHFKLETKFDSMYFTKFEAFCLKFLNTFIFTGDLLPIFSSSLDMDQNNNDVEKEDLNESFLSVFSELIELTRIIVNSGYFTNKFQYKVYSFMCDYFSNLNQQYDKFTSSSTNSNNDFKQQIFKPKLLEKYLNELNLMNRKRYVMSLKDLCRYEINYCLFSSNNKQDSIYMKILSIDKHLGLLDFLTYNLITDLFGDDDDFKKRIIMNSSELEEIFKFI
jgi:hypothetical protein